MGKSIQERFDEKYMPEPNSGCWLWDAASVPVKMPTVPNFLRFKDIDGAISIADVPDQQLQEIGERWTKALLEKARELRNG